MKQKPTPEEDRQKFLDAIDGMAERVKSIGDASRKRVEEATQTIEENKSDETR